MKAWLCPAWWPAWHCLACRHITVSAHAVNAWTSGKPREPWEGEEEGSEPMHLPFIDVEEQAQWQSLLPVSARAEVLNPSPQSCKSR